MLDKHLYYPGLTLMIVICMWLGSELFRKNMSKNVFQSVQHFILLSAIVASAFLLIRTLHVFLQVLLNYYASDNHVDYSLRKARTKFQLIQKILNITIVIATISIMLMTFKSIREIGGTLLASAGVLGLIIGFAAQKSLGTLFAGIQIAISQPIRIDDVVVVEGEFGTIGEITLTYVVVNSWDGRRLVLPINYFLEHGFENWTRTSPEIIAKVKLYVDYALPVEDLRKVFMECVAASPLWDGRTRGLVLTECREQTMEVRGTMSVRNSDDAFTLQCEIREKLIAYMMEKYPHCLPTQRVVVKGPS